MSNISAVAWLILCWIYAGYDEQHRSVTLLNTHSARAHTHTPFRPFFHISGIAYPIVTKFGTLDGEWLLSYTLHYFCIFLARVHVLTLSGHPFISQEPLIGLWRNLVCWIVSDCWALHRMLFAFLARVHVRTHFWPTIHISRTAFPIAMKFGIVATSEWHQSSMHCTFFPF